MITRKQISKAIKKRVGVEVLVYGDGSDGCFSFYSDDDEIGTVLSNKYTSTVLVCRLNHLSIDQWVESFEAIWES